MNAPSYSLAIQQLKNKESYNKLELITNLLLVVYNNPTRYPMGVPNRIITRYYTLRGNKLSHQDADVEFQSLTNELLLNTEALVRGCN